MRGAAIRSHCTAMETGDRLAPPRCSPQPDERPIIGPFDLLALSGEPADRAPRHASAACRAPAPHGTSAAIRFRSMETSARFRRKVSPRTLVAAPAERARRQYLSLQPAERSPLSRHERTAARSRHKAHNWWPPAANKRSRARRKWAMRSGDWRRQRRGASWLAPRADERETRASARSPHRSSARVMPARAVVRRQVRQRHWPLGRAKVALAHTWPSRARDQWASGKEGAERASSALEFKRAQVVVAIIHRNSTSHLGFAQVAGAPPLRFAPLKTRSRQLAPPSLVPAHFGRTCKWTRAWNRAAQTMVRACAPN